MATLGEIIRHGVLSCFLNQMIWAAFHSAYFDVSSSLSDPSAYWNAPESLKNTEAWVPPLVVQPELFVGFGKLTK